MLSTKFKTLSAVAIVAALGLGSVAKAATVTYSENFDSLSGTGGFSNNATNGVGAVGVVAPTGGNPNQAFSITSSANAYGDYFSAGSTLPTGTTGTVGVSFDLNRQTSVNPAPQEQPINPVTNPTPGNPFLVLPGPTEAGFGVELLDSSNNLLASLFIENTEITPSNAVSVPALFVNDATGAANTIVSLPAGNAAANGTYGSYSLSVNLDTNTFTVTGPGGTSITESFTTAYDGNGLTVNLASQNQGSGDVGLFDNFSVTSNAVPEPASIAMIGVGSLMLVGRRRRQTA